jgi:hypothetical protein
VVEVTTAAAAGEEPKKKSAAYTKLANYAAPAVQANPPNQLRKDADQRGLRLAVSGCTDEAKHRQIHRARKPSSLICHHLHLNTSIETRAALRAHTHALARPSAQVVETVVVRKSQDTKSAKVATLSPGETCEVIEVGGTNKSGRTRLRLADPAGWVSDRNKEGTRMLEEVVENRGW